MWIVPVILPFAQLDMQVQYIFAHPNVHFNILFEYSNVHYQWIHSLSKQPKPIPPTEKYGRGLTLCASL
jgi:hypothetical protein